MKNNCLIHNSFLSIKRVIDNIPVPVFIKDTDGRYICCNEEFARILELSMEQIIGKTAGDVSEMEFSAIYNEMDSILHSNGGNQMYESILRTKGGIKHKVIFCKSLFFFEGKFLGIIGLIYDFTNRDRLEKKIPTTYEIFKNIYSQAPIGIEIFNSDGNLVSVNNACLEIFGIENEDTVYGFKLFDDPNISMTNKERLKNGEMINYTTSFSFDTVKSMNLYDTKNTGNIQIEVIIKPLNDSNKGIDGYLVMIQNITEKKRIQDELIYLSFHDKMTGLYNKAYFEQELDRMGRCRKCQAGLIICDVENLKLVNDTFGHNIGDELIISAAEIIRKSFRDGDIVARIGGDEFAAIMPDSTEAALKNAVGRIKSNIEKYTGKFKLSISVGTSLRCSENISVKDLFVLADQDMYKNKAITKKLTSK